jgi:hypothetical protein
MIEKFVIDKAIDLTRLMANNCFFKKNTILYFGVIEKKYYDKQLEKLICNNKYYYIDQSTNKHVMILICSDNIIPLHIMMELCIDILRIRKILFNSYNIEYFYDEYFSNETETFNIRTLLYEDDIIEKILLNWNDNAIILWINSFSTYKFTAAMINYILMEYCNYELEGDYLFE